MAMFLSPALTSFMGHVDQSSAGATTYFSCRGLYATGHAAQNQKAVSHCLLIMLQMSQTQTQIHLNLPGWLKCTDEI